MLKEFNLFQREVYVERLRGEAESKSCSLVELLEGNIYFLKWLIWHIILAIVIQKQ